MGSARRRSTLGEHIAAAINKGCRQDSFGNSGVANKSRVLACTGVALLAMNSAQVDAVGLGEIRLQSGLGQPLRATVPVTIGANESLKANCIQTTDTRQSDLKSPPAAAITTPTAISPGSYSVRVETVNPLYEPMYELALLVDCPGTTVLVRHYVLMLDLPGMPVEPVASVIDAPVTQTSAQSTISQSPAAVTNARTTSSAPTNARPATPRRLGSPIPAATEYRVQSGDTLSTIAARIEGRPPNATWDVAMQIFARNPNAFIRANPDLIKLGQVISIPTVAQMQLSAGVTVTNDTSSSPRRSPDPAPATESRGTAITREDALAEIARIEAYTAAQTDVTSSDSEAAAPADPRSPFADETPETAATDQAAAAADTAPTIETVVTVAEDNASSGEINPFVAIALGLLLGLALSLLIVRGRVIETFAALLKRKAPVEEKTPKAVEVDTFNEFDASVSDFQGSTSNDFDASVAGTAFETGAEVDPDATPMQLGTPMEETYIVEVSEAEQTAAEQNSDDELFAPETSVSADDSLAGIDAENVDLLIDTDNTPDAPVGVPDDTVLAKLFDEDFNPATVEKLERTDNMGADNLEPTAEMPAGNLEPTAELPMQNLEPTAEMPMENLEPTAELPANFADPLQTNEATAELPANFVDPLEAHEATAELSGSFIDPADVIDPTAAIPGGIVDPADVIDPTAEMPAAERAAQMSMTQSFSENLERLDQSNESESSSGDAAPATSDSPTNTLQSPGAGLSSLNTGEFNLEELVKGASEDESLSQTLHEALTLLERDYEDEFTASQILERKEIEKALEEDDDETIAARKVKR